MYRDNAHELIRQIKLAADQLAALPSTYFPPVLYVSPANPLEAWESDADLGPAITDIRINQGQAVLTVNPALIPMGCKVPPQQVTRFWISYGPIHAYIDGYIAYADATTALTYKV
jgi:hypothetical protein